MLARKDLPNRPEQWSKRRATTVCHMQCRIGRLLDEPYDHWWTIEEGHWSHEIEQLPATIAASMMPMLEERAVPWLLEHLTDPAYEAQSAQRHVLTVLNMTLVARRRR